MPAIEAPLRPRYSSGSVASARPGTQKSQVASKSQWTNTVSPPAKDTAGTGSIREYLLTLKALVEQIFNHSDHNKDIVSFSFFKPPLSSQRRDLLNCCLNLAAPRPIVPAQWIRPWWIKTTSSVTICTSDRMREIKKYRFPKSTCDGWTF